MSEKLKYGLVAHGAIILAEYSPSTGDFAQVAHQLLRKIDLSKDVRMAYDSGEYTFDYMVKDEMTYLCVCGKDVKTSIPFSFLKKASEQFSSMFGQQGKQATVPYQFNADFAPTLRKLMEYYNSPHFNADAAEKITDLRSELDDVKGVIHENISKVLDRGEQLENLHFSTEKMVDSSQAFRSSATRLRHKVWWNNIKVQAMGCGLLCFILFLLSAWACGGITFQDCSLGNR